MIAQIGIIGGTGIYNPDMLTNIEEHQVATPYGDINVKVGQYAGQKIAFLPRHGAKHSLPPHKINYRGNIMALKKLGVQRIIATAAVGSLHLEMKPGHLVILDQFIDFTKNRPATFFEDSDKPVIHIDMTEPYCQDLRNILIQAANKLDLPVHNRATYVCTEGPRFETPAEIRMYKKLDAQLVGMTSVPEVVLAREAEICYASIALVTNFAAGISPKPLTHTEVIETMRDNTANLQKIIMKTIELLGDQTNCTCQNALQELGSLG